MCAVPMQLIIGGMAMWTNFQDVVVEAEIVNSIDTL